MIGSPSLNLTWSRRMLSLSSHDLWTRPYDTLLGEEKPKLSKESHIWLDLENRAGLCWLSLKDAQVVGQGALGFTASRSRTPELDASDSGKMAVKM